MASAWGNSWGKAWGNSWGKLASAIAPEPTGQGRIGGGFPGYSTYYEPDRSFNPLAALEKDDEEVILLATSWLMEITANG